MKLEAEQNLTDQTQSHSESQLYLRLCTSLASKPSDSDFAVSHDCSKLFSSILFSLDVLLIGKRLLFMGGPWVVRGWTVASIEDGVKSIKFLLLGNPQPRSSFKGHSVSRIGCLARAHQYWFWPVASGKYLPTRGYIYRFRPGPPDFRPGVYFRG